MRQHIKEVFLLVISSCVTFGALAKTDAISDSIELVVNARFAQIDTVFARAIRADTVNAELPQLVRTEFSQILEEESFLVIRKALRHIYHNTFKYRDPQSVFVGVLSELDAIDFSKYSDKEQADILIEAMSIATRSGDHNKVMLLVERFQQLDQRELSIEDRADVAYKIGYVQYYEGDYVASADAFAVAAKLSVKSGNLSMGLNALDASSSAYLESGDNEKALSYAKQAVAKIQASTVEELDGFSSVNIYLNFAEALHRSGYKRAAYDTAMHAYHNALSIKEDSDIGRALLTIGRLYMIDGEFSIAIRKLEKAQEIFIRTSDVYLVIAAQEYLTDAYAGAANYEQAYLYHRKYILGRDTLEAAEQEATVDQLIANYKAQANQKEIELLLAKQAALEAENGSHRYKLIGMWLMLVLITGLCCYVFYRLKLRRRSQNLLEDMVSKRTEELSDYAKKLERSNAELERFAYIASHDLKTPLRNVTSFLGLIDRRLDPVAKVTVAEYLKIAKENAKQMHHLVTDVLEFSKINADISSQSEMFNVGDRVKGMIAQMGPQLAAKNASVCVDGFAEIYAPESYIIQLINNLIENGLKYNESPAPRVHVTLSEFGEEISISVMDNGIGIAPEYYDRVFELFKRLHTSDTYSGTGLGLAVCKKVIERMGGSISLQSTPGEGSTFTVILPKDCSTTSIQQETSTGLALSKKSIPVVEAN